MSLTLRGTDTLCKGIANAEFFPTMCKPHFERFYQKGDCSPPVVQEPYLSVFTRVSSQMITHCCSIQGDNAHTLGPADLLERLSIIIAGVHGHCASVVSTCWDAALTAIWCYRTC